MRQLDMICTDQMIWHGYAGISFITLWLGFWLGWKHRQYLKEGE